MKNFKDGFKIGDNNLIAKPDAAYRLEEVGIKLGIRVHVNNVNNESGDVRLTFNLNRRNFIPFNTCLTELVLRDEKIRDGSLFG